jgi:thiocyanate hydrolase subunit alpha
MSRFEVGDKVRITAQLTMFHSRVPHYARGGIGVIERVLPEFVIPEDDAFGRLWAGGRTATLYRVRLHQASTWPGYRGPDSDEHQLEIFEHQLEAAKEDVA